MSGAPTLIEGQQLAPFVRGLAWGGPDASGGVPRVPTELLATLPRDTALEYGTADGVSLEVTGDAARMTIDYEARPGPRARWTGADAPAVEVWAGGSRRAVAPMPMGRGSVEVPLTSGANQVCLPNQVRLTLRGVRAWDGEIEPADPRPRWLAYGDSITSGWVASGPTSSWVSIAARQLELEACNLGAAGSARGEHSAAEAVAAAPAIDIISLAFGTNCWSASPATAGEVGDRLVAFVRTVQAAKPATPILVVSPVVRPAAELDPNTVGATLQDIRGAIEAGALDLAACGDGPVTLLRGGTILDAQRLPDGVHPDDTGHRQIAAALVEAVRSWPAASGVLSPRIGPPIPSEVGTQ